MADAGDISRRAALSAPAAMLLASSACAQERPASGATSLVAYSPGPETPA